MQDFFNWQGVIGTIIGIIGTVFAWFAWRKSKEVENFLEKEKARLNEKIKIILKQGENEYILPDLRRQDITRSEIQGRLGVIPMKVKGKRYAIEFTNSPEFYRQIDLLSEGSNDTGNSSLIIACTNEEFAQFKFDSPKIETKKRVKKVKENNGK